MLCMNNYTQKYIDECRSSVAAQVSAYQTLVITATRNQTVTDEPLLNAAIEAFAPHFFNNMMCADKTIKYDPAKSVLKYRVGDEAKLSQADFILLSSAFLAEIERKYL